MEESDSKSYTGIECLLSKEARLKIRRYIFHGTESFANRATDHTWLRSVFGPTFDDIEIAISADGFTCERAPMILPNEYATFVRITEKWSKDSTFVIENTSPRSLTIGLILSLTGNTSRPAAFRMWDECPIKWVGGSGDKPLAALNDPSELDKILHELRSGFMLACSKPLEQLQQESNAATTSNVPSSLSSSRYAAGGANATSGASAVVSAKLTPVSEMPEVD